jgi:hypothetical protein
MQRRAQAAQAGRSKHPTVCPSQAKECMDGPAFPPLDIFQNHFKMFYRYWVRTSTIHETEKNSMSNEYHLSSEDLVESLVDAVNRNGDFKQLSSYSIQCISKVRNC